LSDGGWKTEERRETPYWPTDEKYTTTHTFKAETFPCNRHTYKHKPVHHDGKFGKMFGKIEEREKAE
jgi:hypothetical protein